MSLVKCVGKEVKVQRQFLNFLEQADDRDKENQPTEGSNAMSSTDCPADALTESNNGEDETMVEEAEEEGSGSKKKERIKTIQTSS